MLSRGQINLALKAPTQSSAEKSGAVEMRERLKNLSLYQEFQAEREEILRHKWLESEKAGRDIGFENALIDWIMNHRANWRKSRQESKAVSAPSFD